MSTDPTPEALLLFDIDLTLIDTARAGSVAFSRAVLRALEREDDLAWVVFHGATDGQIAWDVLAKHGHEDRGVAQPTHDALLTAYVEYLLEELPARQGRIMPGAREALEKVSRDPRFLVGLLTGNLRRGAEIKLGHFDLWHYFNGQPGAFGDDHTERNELPAIASSRALTSAGAEFPPERIWIIGDTPRDIACGRAFGTRVLAIGAGHYSVEQLAEHQPDLLLASLEEFDPEALLK